MSSFYKGLQIMQHLTDHTLHRTPLVTDLSAKKHNCFIHDDCIREPDHNIQAVMRKWGTLILLMHNVHFRKRGKQKRQLSGAWNLLLQLQLFILMLKGAEEERRKPAAAPPPRSSPLIASLYIYIFPPLEKRPLKPEQTDGLF